EENLPAIPTRHPRRWRWRRRDPAVVDEVQAALVATFDGHQAPNMRAPRRAAHAAFPARRTATCGRRRPRRWRSRGGAHPTIVLPVRMRFPAEESDATLRR